MIWRGLEETLGRLRNCRLRAFAGSAPSISRTIHLQLIAGQIFQSERLGQESRSDLGENGKVAMARKKSDWAAIQLGEIQPPRSHSPSSVS